ncbi:MAG: hypothetical protein RL235_932 [Chlamydiota bacterium]
MSDMQESAAAAPAVEGVVSNTSFTPKSVEQGSGSLDGQSYVKGEVPQSFLADPQAFLPLNSDSLIGGAVDALVAEAGQLIQDEVTLIQKAQKRIALWEERIEKNRAIVQVNESQVKQNLVDIGYDKKNRDYWLGRAEQVMLDYQHAEAGGRETDWSWIVKKYGLKNPDGTPIDAKAICVDELCNGAASNLASEYKTNGNKYETARKEKEAKNTEMIRENGRMLNSNEQLRGYISTAYGREIEPLQDGVLLYKELGLKLKALSQMGDKATYAALRSWAETMLDEFIKANPRVPQHVVTEFRRLASIPLPPHHA